MAGPELKSFRESRWRYSQFVMVALAAAGLIKWLTPKMAKPGGVPPRLTSVQEQRASHAPRAADGGWRIGQGVRHARFGEGVIVNLEGGGYDQRMDAYDLARAGMVVAVGGVWLARKR